MDSTQHKAPGAENTGYASGLTDAEFSHVASLVHRNTGIQLEAHKRQMVQARISRRLRILNLKGFAEYLHFLSTTPEEVEHFTNALTTNLTAFFREEHHFGNLRDTLSARAHSKLRIWSAGCSSGEEPYSIAMVLRDLPYLNQCDAKVLATDIDTVALATAQKGQYPIEKRTPIPTTYDRFLEVHSDHFSCSQDIRNLVTFKRLNLMEAWPFGQLFDIIFCRNVIIYFDKPTKTKLISRFVDQLTSGGLLFLGHSETLIEDIPNLRSLGKTMYRKEAA